MVRTRCIGEVAAMIPSRLCCPATGADPEMHTERAPEPPSPDREHRTAAASRGLPPVSPTGEEGPNDMADYSNPDVLVNTDWLEEHLDDRGVRVVEVDEDTTA